MAHAEPEAAAGPGVLLDLILGLILFALAATSYILSRQQLHHWETPVALAIAVAKATLIVLFYMHLLQHKASSRIAFSIALIFLLLLGTLTMTDIGFRYRPTRPPGPIPLDLSTPPADLSETPFEMRPPQRGREQPDQGRQGP